MRLVSAFWRSLAVMSRFKAFRSAVRVALAALLSICSVSASAGTIYDLKTDWSDANNPNGVWTLRDGNNIIPYMADYSIFRQFDSAYSPPTGPIAQPAFAYNVVAGDHIPVWFKAAVTPNGDAYNTYDWRAGDIIVHTTDSFNSPPERGEANVLWTSTSAGTAHVYGNVWDGRTSLGRVNIWELWITQGSVSSMFASGILVGSNVDDINRATPATFDFQNVALSTSDTVMLKLYKPEGGIGDFVGVNMTIDFTPVPEPDKTPPVIHGLTPNPRSLWPPNKKMVNVIVGVSATDDVTPNPTCTISGWASNEPDAGSEDIGPVNADGLGISLRAKRAGNGSGRIYALAVTCSDAAGNEANAVTTVTVPHSPVN